MKKSIIAFLLLSMLFSCKKDQPKQYSTWYVNGQKFTTNDVTLSHSKGSNHLFTNDRVNGFGLYLSMGPLIGGYTQHILACGYSNPKYSCFDIYYKSRLFRPHGGTLYVKSVNDKAQFTMSETWFYSGNDSILVKGTFNEP